MRTAVFAWLSLRPHPIAFAQDLAVTKITIYSAPDAPAHRVAGRDNRKNQTPLAARNQADEKLCGNARPSGRRIDHAAEPWPSTFLLTFALQGVVMPAPVFATRDFGAAGLYREVRDPMYVAVVSTNPGQGLAM